MSPAQSGRSAGAFALAQRYLEQARPDRALETLERSDPDDVRYWGLLALALHASERYADAAGAAREGLKRGADSVPLLYVLASAQTELGELAEAEITVLEAIRLEPQDVSTLSLYARMLAAGRQPDKAAAVVAEARRLEPQNGTVLRTHAFVQWIQARDQDALQTVRELLSRDPDDQAALLLLSAIESEEGAHHTSYGRVRRVLAGQPTLIKLLGPDMAERAAAAHPLMAPIRPVFTTAGPAVLWLTMITTGLLALALRQYWIVFAVFGLYITYALYSHVVYRLLRWYYKRRMG